MDRVAPLLQFAPSEGAVFRFFGGPARRDGADAFAGRTGRAIAEGGRSRDNADGFVASMIDGGAGAFYCTGLRPRIPTVESKNRNYFWAV